jgi:hypothetical protein
MKLAIAAIAVLSLVACRSDTGTSSLYAEQRECTKQEVKRLGAATTNQGRCWGRSPFNQGNGGSGNSQSGKSNGGG